MRIIRTTSVVAVIAIASLLGVPAPSAAQRLPLLAAPEHYQLHLEPDLDAETFNGTLRLRLRVLTPTRKLVLHAVGLTIDDAWLHTNRIRQRAIVAVDPRTQTATFHVPADVQPGLAELEVAYAGVLNRELRGFYVSKAGGRKYAVTQLEPTDARRMFPSFDEPLFKATFDLSVTVDEADEAISNGAVETVTRGPRRGKKTIDFVTTPLMSTYLVALAVGDFECTAPALVGGAPVRICATPGNEALTSFPLEAARASLEYLNRYFAIDYPFGKLDLVAIPDFAAGAMENIGAVFFREALLLVAPDAAVTARKRAALVIAHELAHQWFGNLVTMRWWDDLWLNEGFATWMETKAVAAWRPGWDVELDARQATQRAMRVDALTSTRSVRTTAETPDAINELFDPIAYDKGAAVLAMIEAFVGEEAFRNGLNAYLEQHKYANATAEHFWSVLSRATREPVDRIMRTFVDRPGVPLVTVETACREGETVVTLTQDRFAASSPERRAAAPWSIPVCVETRGNGPADRCVLLEKAQETLVLPGCARWVVANARAEGYYRTRYSADALERLAKANASLLPEERLMLLTDAWALLRAGRGDVDGFLELVASLATDIRRPTVLASAASRVRAVHEYFTTDESRAPFEEWVRSQFEPALHAVPRVGDDSLGQAERQAVLLALLGVVGRDADVIADARRVVDTYLCGERVDVPGTVLDAMVAIAASAGEPALYDEYRRRAETADTPDERYRFLYALAAFGDPVLVRRTVEYALSAAVRTQDRAALLAATLRNPAGRDLAWRLIQTHWPELQRSLGAFGGTGRVIEALGAFCAAERADEIRRFFTVHPVATATRTLQQAVEDIEQCARVASIQDEVLGRWLAGATHHHGR